MHTSAKNTTANMLTLRRAHSRDYEKEKRRINKIKKNEEKKYARDEEQDGKKRKEETIVV